MCIRDSINAEYGEHFITMSDEDIVLSTTPQDTRFPNVNQARHCFSRFNEYNRCVARNGEDKCVMLKKFYAAVCPNEWVNNWTEQIEAGTFAGPTFEEGTGKMIHARANMH
eukprot:TRINITY_DN44490_c0_g1_i2.p2 TRINITY_DN44490_c0_g1~~TRINITY_DN44490_c0_g1_i2.p2  ORF type:complete len:111 (-),score=37.22 TRINITY_DN44490_c0_g1_i2:273-605(-)